MINFPKHIYFVSDENEAEFVNEIVGSKLKERIANYKYIKAMVNDQMVFSLFLSQIAKLQQEKLVICQ
jgi:hypothetical protein